MTFCVQFTQVGKRFGDNWILRNLDVQLPAGRTSAILGQSGSGKTTLLRVINAMYLPDEGTVEVMGKPVPDTQLHQFRRQIGYAVQGAGLYPHMSIHQNISCLAQLESWSETEIEQRIAYLMDLTGLSLDLLSRYPHELSGGQQHRVGLCRALMLKPNILLLDEPFSAIDAITRNEIHDSFIHLQRTLEISTVLVTHDFSEVKRLADYLVVLVDGQIAQQGALREVLDHPESPFLQNLIKTSA